jgi:hypothetical protein
LPSFDLPVSRYQVGCGVVGPQKRQGDALRCETSPCLFESLPPQMPGETVHYLIGGADRIACEHTSGASRMQHACRDKVRAANHSDVRLEFFGNGRVIKVGQYHQQRALSQSHTKEMGQFAEIRRDPLRLHCKQSIAAGAKVRPARSSPNDCLYPLIERDYTEEIAVLLYCKSQQ